MKVKVVNYTFVASTKTITLTNYGTLRLDSVLAVFNATRGTVYVVPGNSSYTPTVATNVITLNAAVSTAGHADADKLTIFYDYPDRLDKHISASGTLVANTVTTQTLTQSGFAAFEVEVTNVNGAAAMYGTVDGSTPSSTNFAFVLPATPSTIVLPMLGTSPTLKLISAATPAWAATLRGS